MRDQCQTETLSHVVKMNERAKKAASARKAMYGKREVDMGDENGDAPACKVFRSAVVP